MIGSSSSSIASGVKGGAAGSSGAIDPSLRTSAGMPDDRCRSDAPASHIERNSESIGSVPIPSLLRPFSVPSPSLLRPYSVPTPSLLRPCSIPAPPLHPPHSGRMTGHLPQFHDVGRVHIEVPVGALEI